VQCPRCDTSVSDSAEFCRHCGVPLGDGGDPDRTTRRAPVEVARAASSVPPPREDDDTVALASQDETAVSTTACVACGAANSARRELCGHCGADLESGMLPPVADDEAAPTPRPRQRRADHGREHRRGLPVWALVLGLLALVGAIVLALSLAGLGPLAVGPSLPEAEFDAEAYGGDPGPLPLAEIATSTTLEADDGVEHDASHMADDDPATAWRSDGERFEDGVGETIDLHLTDPAWVERLVVNNGLQRDADGYAENARIRRAELVLDGGERISIRLEDLGLQRQAIEFPEPRLTTTIRVEVTESFPGDDTPDLAVSDTVLEGWQARGEDIERAQELAERAGAARPTR
jgi:ribosomal protein L40E